VIGQTKLEAGLKKLDKLTNEEVTMACAQLVKVTNSINNTVTRVDAGVSRVDENVLVVKNDVELVNDNVKAINDNVKAVDDKVQTIADGGQRLFSESSALWLTFIIQMAKRPQRK
jgi:methyl-accepting chemotaxis protein